MSSWLFDALRAEERPPGGKPATAPDPLPHSAMGVTAGQGAAGRPGGVAAIFLDGLPLLPREVPGAGQTPCHRAQAWGRRGDRLETAFGDLGLAFPTGWRVLLDIAAPFGRLCVGLCRTGGTHDLLSHRERLQPRHGLRVGLPSRDISRRLPTTGPHGVAPHGAGIRRAQIPWAGR